MRRVPFVLLLCFLSACSTTVPLPEADAVSSIQVFLKFPPPEWRQRAGIIADRDLIQEFLDVVGKARTTGEQAEEVIGVITLDVASGKPVELGLTPDLAITVGTALLDVPPDWVQDYLLAAGVIEPWIGEGARMGDGDVEPGDR